MRNRKEGQALKQKIQQLIAFIILLIGLTAIILLTGAMANDFMKPGTYLIGMGVSVIALYLDGGWIGKHFINNEWV
jgi:hypothetical protein